MAAGLALGVLGGQAAVAQEEFVPPEVVVTDRNAALLYHRVWMYMDRDLQELWVSGEPSTLAEGGAAMLRDSQDTIRAILKATRQDHADWEVEFEQGPHALLPNLGKLRATARVLAADALRCAEDGDPAGAAERIGALYRMGEHSTPETFYIGSLVGLAISNLGNRLANQLLDADVLDAHAAGVLLAELERVDLDNPLNIREAIRQERDGLADYFLTHCTGPDAGQQLLEHVPAMVGDDSDVMEGPLSAMDGDALRRDFQGYRRFYDDVLSVWDEPDAGKRITEMEQATAEGEYGQVAKIFSASLSKSRQHAEAFRDDHTALLDRLRQAADG